jgi:hypothetical protein
MLLINSTYRAIVFGLISLGMVVPAWATQPCKCGEKDGCCATHDTAKSSCCAQKPCCAARLDEHNVSTCSAQSVGCPCCTEAAPPARTVPQQATVSQVDQQSVAVVANMPGVIPPIASVDYLTRSLGSPPGHPVLRLHALYRVWLN